MVKLRSDNASEIRAWEKICNLDLEPIIFKLVKDPDSGIPWSVDQADEGALEYRKFLFLYWKFGTKNLKTVAPSQFVDKFWHQHILDCEKYIQDCEAIFATRLQVIICRFLRFILRPLGITIHAGFMNHFPYFGMRGDQDYQNLQEAFQEGKNLINENFTE